MLLRAQWLAAATKGRGCYKRATARPSSKQTGRGSETNTRPSVFKKISQFKHLRYIEHYFGFCFMSVIYFTNIFNN